MENLSKTTSERKASEMKKWIPWLLTALLALSLTACAGGTEEENGGTELSITKADGTVVTMTSQEVMDVCDTNEIDYNTNYRGCAVTVTGPVASVDQERSEIFDNIWADVAHITLGDIQDGPQVEFDIVIGDNSYADFDFAGLTKGTMVTAQGKLGEAFVTIGIDEASDLALVTEGA